MKAMWMMTEMVDASLATMVMEVVVSLATVMSHLCETAMSTEATSMEMAILEVMDDVGRFDPVTGVTHYPKFHGFTINLHPGGAQKQQLK